MKKKVIIVAAGNGTRMGSDLPKQFLLLDGKPLLYYSIRSFIHALKEVEIILVLPKDHIAKGEEVIDGFFDRSVFTICAGGETRFESVKCGLAKIGEECIIFVHDGARCLVSEELIRRCYESALKSGTAVPVIPCKDSVRILGEDGFENINRDNVKLVQTPQAFHSKILIPAYQIDYKVQFTDEASIVEAYGLKVQLVEGEERNIKLTTPLDLRIAEELIAQNIPQ